jgi:hypothetical protein
MKFSFRFTFFKNYYKKFSVLYRIMFLQFHFYSSINKSEILSGNFHKRRTFCRSLPPIIFSRPYACGLKDKHGGNLS